MQLTEEMQNEGWKSFESAPDGEVVELMVITPSGRKRVEYGQWDAMDGQFYTHGDLWPTALEPIAWRPIPPFDWRPVWLFLAGVAGGVGVGLSFICLLR